jgi:hypothetical protein
MSYVITKNVKGFTYWLKLAPAYFKTNTFEGIDKYHWEGLINNATVFHDRDRIQTILDKLKHFEQFEDIEIKDL